MHHHRYLVACVALRLRQPFVEVPGFDALTLYMEAGEIANDVGAVSAPAELLAAPGRKAIAAQDRCEFALAGCTLGPGVYCHFL